MQRKRRLEDNVTDGASNKRTVRGSRSRRTMNSLSADNVNWNEIFDMQPPDAEEDVLQEQKILNDSLTAAPTLKEQGYPAEPQQQPPDEFEEEESGIDDEEEEEEDEEDNESEYEEEMGGGTRRIPNKSGAKEASDNEEEDSEEDEEEETAEEQSNAQVNSAEDPALMIPDWKKLSLYFDRLNKKLSHMKWIDSYVDALHAELNSAASVPLFDADNEPSQPDLKITNEDELKKFLQPTHNHHLTSDTPNQPLPLCDASSGINAGGWKQIQMAKDQLCHLTDAFYERFKHNFASNVAPSS